MVSSLLFSRFRQYPASHSRLSVVVPWQRDFPAQHRVIEYSMAAAPTATAPNPTFPLQPLLDVSRFLRSHETSITPRADHAVSAMLPFMTETHQFGSVLPVIPP